MCLGGLNKSSAETLCGRIPQRLPYRLPNDSVDVEGSSKGKKSQFCLTCFFKVSESLKENFFC